MRSALFSDKIKAQQFMLCFLICFIIYLFAYIFS